jgi:predicted O-methyltransferase YrrM
MLAKITFLLLVAIFLLLVAIFYKIRKIHISTFGIAPIKTEVFTLFSQIEATMALQKITELSYPLPPTRGWAGSPDFLLKIAEELILRKPKQVMECSSGISTIICARILQKNGIGHVYSLEHDPIYAQKTRAMLAQHGLEQWATIVDAPLSTGGGEQPWYTLTNLPQSAAAIEVLIVDGPPSTTSPLARYPAIPRLAGRMAPSSVVIIDDADRPDEKIILNQWRKEFPDFVQTDAFCEKGCVFLDRTNKS